ncbi:MAG: DUF433 domain-containing protein [Chloroflexi bacterium]|nr:DUF433 domain-containing protein [Chloroflexota bacterium]
MGGRPESLRIPEEVRAAIDETVRRTGRDFARVANEMLAEAIKMRRIPGIVFADGPAGRVARIAGTGLEVFEVIGAHRAMDESWERLRQAYHWLSEHQLRAALAYASAYPDEIESRLKEEDRWTPETVWATYPFTKPRDR